MSKLVHPCAALFLLVCISVSGFAQVNAVIGGTVSDPSGALIPGVEVTAKNINTGIVTTRITNETGAYERSKSHKDRSHLVRAAISDTHASAERLDRR